jgi:hypothetical protein
VEWFSYREEYLRSVGVFKEAVLAILAAIAKQERIRLSERVQAGLSRARANGKVLGRPKAAVRPERVLPPRTGHVAPPDRGGNRSEHNDCAADSGGRCFELMMSEPSAGDGDGLRAGDDTSGLRTMLPRAEPDTCDAARLV